MSARGAAWAARAGLLALVAMGLSGCHVPGEPKAGAIPVRPDQVRQFGVLYAQNCAGCHGENGQRGVAVSLGSPAYVAYAGVANIERITAQGIGGYLMPAFARSSGGLLTDQQIAILANGIVSKWGNAAALGGATPPVYASTAHGDAGAGAKLYQADCLRCHAPGSGSILDPSYVALVSDGGLRTLMVVGKPHEGMPDWRGYPGGALTDQQLADLVAFLVAHRTATPGQPFHNAQGDAPAVPGPDAGNGDTKNAAGTTPGAAMGGPGHE